MRQRNMRFVITGGIMVALAVFFFLFMLGMADKSTDPKALMETVGSVSGVVGGLGIALAIMGFVGTKKA